MTGFEFRSALGRTFSGDGSCWERSWGMYKSPHKDRSTRRCVCEWENTVKDNERLFLHMFSTFLYKHHVRINKDTAAVTAGCAMSSLPVKTAWANKRDMIIMLMMVKVIYQQRRLSRTDRTGHGMLSSTRAFASALNKHASLGCADLNWYHDSEMNEGFRCCGWRSWKVCLPPPSHPPVHMW